MPESLETPTSVIQHLREEGYDLEVDVRDGAVQFRVDLDWVPAGDVAVERTYRFEGDTNPGDEMIVLAVRDDQGRRGTLLAAYGPQTDAETAQTLRGLVDADKG